MAGAVVRFDYRVGDASLANAALLGAVCLTTPRRAILSQVWALPAILALSLPGPAGGPADWGYTLGRVGAAWALTRLLATGADRPGRSAVLAPLAVMLAVGAWAIWSWRAADPRLQLRAYYMAVLGLALAIGFYYTLRLVDRPARIPVLLAGLWPYYAAGIGWTALFALLVSASPDVSTGPSGLVFHGLVAHVPGDLLTAVVVAAFTNPRTAVGGRASR